MTERKPQLSTNEDDNVSMQDNLKEIKELKTFIPFKEIIDRAHTRKESRQDDTRVLKSTWKR